MIEQELPNWTIEEVVHHLNEARKAHSSLLELKKMLDYDISVMTARLEELTNPKPIENV